MNIWTLLLNALVKELETNPDRVFALLEKVIDLFQKHPEAVTAAIQMLPKQP